MIRYLGDVIYTVIRYLGDVICTKFNLCDNVLEESLQLVVVT